MVNLRKVRNIGILVFFVIITSCRSTLNETKRNYVSLTSVLERDLCTFYIDNIEYMLNKPVVTDRSLGIDPDDFIEFTSQDNKVVLSVKFHGDIISGGNVDETREIKFDTIVDLKYGRYFLITGRINKIELLQDKNKIVLD